MPDVNDDAVDDMEEPCPVEDEVAAKQCPICCHSSGDGGWISKLNELPVYKDSLSKNLEEDQILKWEHFEKFDD